MDVLSLTGDPLGAWIPGAGGLFGAPQYLLSAGNQVTVVKTVSTAIFEPSCLNRHFQDLDAGELPGELTPVHRDAAL
jgi:hypothetical protein